VSELAGHAVGVVTLLLMLVFLGIWYWAWRPRHRASFDALARLPMCEAEQPPALEGRPPNDGSDAARAEREAKP
jgi:cbb3-type cytochrome oxidase subunit 3